MLYAFSATLSSYNTPSTLDATSSVPEIFGQLVLAQAIHSYSDSK